MNTTSNNSSVLDEDQWTTEVFSNWCTEKFKHDVGLSCVLVKNNVQLLIQNRTESFQ